MTLRFGKYKGQQFASTPKSYQDWLLNQDWYKAPKTETPMNSKSLNGWDGYSQRGQAIYDAIFEKEKAESESHYCGCGKMKEPKEKFCGYGCIAEIGM